LRRAIDEHRTAHRAAVGAKLGKSTIESWAEPLVRKAEESDAVLRVLLELETFCEGAMRASSGIQILSD
jgi:hypothetical protein